MTRKGNVIKVKQFRSSMTVIVSHWRQTVSIGTC